MGHRVKHNLIAEETCTQKGGTTMNYSKKELSELEKLLKTNFAKGLSEADSKRRRGGNVIKTKKRAGFFRMLLAQMSDFMTVVLLFAAAASYFSTHMRGETDIFEPLLIVAIVLLNALLGVFQQRRAERAIDALKKLADPHVKVLRGGIWQQISAEDLAVGDIVKVETGRQNCRRYAHNRIGRA